MLNCLTECFDEADMELEGKSLRRMEGLTLVGERLAERGAWSGAFGARDGAMLETWSAHGRAMRRGRLVGLNMLNVSKIELNK